MARSKENTPADNGVGHDVYVVEGEKAYWTKVGRAWQHKDGQGFNVSLSPLPISGRLVIRARKEER